MYKRNIATSLFIICVFVSSHLVSGYTFSGTYTSLSNQTVSFSSHEGNIIMIEAIQTQCGYCRDENYRNKKNYLYSQYYDQMEFLMLSINPGDSLEDLQNFINRFSIEWEAGLDDNNVFENRFSIGGTPTTVLLREDGSLIKTWFGIDTPISGYMNIMNEYVDAPVTEIPTHFDDTNVGGGSGNGESIIGNFISNPIFQGTLIIFVVLTFYVRATATKPEI